MSLKEHLKQYKTFRRPVMLAKRAYAARTNGYPLWQKLIGNEWSEWLAALDAAKGGKKVLFATSVGAFLPSSTLESLLSIALTLRGADVHVLLCDETLPACTECQMIWYRNDEDFIEYGPHRDLCRDCYWPAERMYQSLGITLHRYSEFLIDEEVRQAEEISSSIPYEEIESYTLDGLSIGEHAWAGALRFYARGTLEAEPNSEAVLRRYLKASLLTLFSVRHLIREHNYDCVVATHGIYIPTGIISQVSRQLGARFVTWNVAYRKHRFIFSHGDTYHHTLMDEPVEKWEDLQWTSRIEMELMKYLKSRWQGTQDWIWFHDKPRLDLQSIAAEVGVDFTKPCVGLLTNVMWDAQLHYPANAFPNMLEWVLQTIEYFKNRPELQLVIRVHPAEVRGMIPSRQPIVSEIKKAYPALPNNVFVIPPESQVSTYATMLQCDSVLIYGTKTGVELTSLGIPVIVAGEAWIRNKGFTLDANSVENYFQILDQLPFISRLDEEKIRRARKYAYHFFFRRMIPIEYIIPQPDNSYYQVEITGLNDLGEGYCKGVDVICDGILKGCDFIYPEESLDQKQVNPSNFIKEVR